MEIQNQTKTAEYFNCDIATVRAACQEYGVTILSSQQIAKNTSSKCIRMLPDNIVFISINDGIRYIQEHGYTCSVDRRGIYSHIARAIKTGIRAYGKYWEQIEK